MSDHKITHMGVGEDNTPAVDDTSQMAVIQRLETDYENLVTEHDALESALQTALARIAQLEEENERLNKDLDYWRSDTRWQRIEHLDAALREIAAAVGHWPHSHVTDGTTEATCKYPK